MKCLKMKKYSYRGLSVFIALYLSLCSCIGSYASDSTSSGSFDSWEMNAGTFLELVWAGYAKEISAPFVIWNTLNGCNYDDFVTWMQDGDHYYLLEDGTVVGHGGAGYSRPSDKINHSEDIEVDPELKQYVLNYVQYCTTQTDLGYKECYVYSYKFLDPTIFPNYASYINSQQLIKNYDGFTFIIGLFDYGSNGKAFNYAQMSHSANYAFIGTTTQGSFTNVRPYVDWVTFGPNVTRFYINSARKETFNTGINLAGTRNVSDFNINNATVFSSYEKNELVYVFDTLNSYKNYNSGMPQPYYLTTSGMNTGTWTASGGGVINTGSMTNSGNYYSSVTSGVGSNWTPDQILALVDKVANANSGSGGSGSSNDNSKWWEKIGNALGNLIDGIIDVLSTVIEHLSDALLSVIHLLTGYTDENGNVHEGLFGKLLNLVNSGFNNFLASIFSWLPEEIVTLFTAVLVFGIFFGLLKMLRR